MKFGERKTPKRERLPIAIKKRKESTSRWVFLEAKRYRKRGILREGNEEVGEMKNFSLPS